MKPNFRNVFEARGLEQESLVDLVDGELMSLPILWVTAEVSVCVILGATWMQGLRD